MSDDTVRIGPNVILGENVRFVGFANLYGCTIGDDTLIGPFVEIQCDVTIGARVKLQSHTFVCSGVTIEDEAFIGHGVMFVNDLFPRSTTRDGKIKRADDWKCETVHIGRRASIGSNATIVGSVTIGEEAVIGAGAVVTKDVPPRTIVAGNPAKIIRKLD